MADASRIGGSPGPQPQTISNTPDVETTPGTGSPGGTKINKPHENAEDAGKTSRALKQQAAETMGQHFIAGTLKQKELQQSMLSEGKGSHILSKQELEKHNIKQERTKDGITNTYPGGLKIEINTEKKIGKTTVSGHMITPPPGGTMKSGADGSTRILDANGKEVATTRELANGDVQIKIGQREFTQHLDGNVTLGHKLPDTGVRKPQQTSKQGPGGPTDFKELGKDIGQLGVQREKTKDGITTVYPGGVVVGRSHTYDIEKRILVTSRSVTHPPGGTMEELKDGSMRVLDKNGKEVAIVRQEDNGKVHIQTKQGEFIEHPDGRTTFIKKS
jgi:hypothetical protein